jgi:Domain of unknown function (DUF4214)
MATAGCRRAQTNGSAEHPGKPRREEKRRDVCRGLEAWEGGLSNGMSRTTFDQLVVGSPEFQSDIQGPAVGSFVNTLYEQALGREAEPQGFAAWTGALTSGALNQAAVAVGIAESPEAQHFLVQKLRAVGI